MIPNTLRLATVVLAVAVLVALSACGGGGGGGGTTVVVPGEGDSNRQQLTGVIERATLQTMFTGVAEEEVYELQCGAPGSQGALISPCLQIIGDFEIPSSSPEEYLKGLERDGQTLTPPSGVDVNGASLSMAEGERKDLVFMTDTTLSYRNLAGWMEHSAIVAGILLSSGELTGIVLAPSTYYSGTIGNATNTNPTFNANWRGAFIGFWTEAGLYSWNTVLGESNIRMNNLGGVSPTVDLFLNNLVNTSNAGHAIEDAKAMGIALLDGAFRSGDGRIKGNFFGSQHEEVAGVYIRDELAGAFLGRR